VRLLHLGVIYCQPTTAFRGTLVHLIAFNPTINWDVTWVNLNGSHKIFTIIFRLQIIYWDSQRYRKMGVRSATHWHTFIHVRSATHWHTSIHVPSYSVSIIVSIFAKSIMIEKYFRRKVLIIIPSELKLEGSTEWKSYKRFSCWRGRRRTKLRKRGRPFSVPKTSGNLFVIKPTRCTNFTNLFWHETLHVSAVLLPIISSLFTVHSATVYVIQALYTQLSSRTRMELQFHPGPTRKVVYKPVWHIQRCG
jgi:hypothetical protein